MVNIFAKGQKLVAHRAILTKNSGYFASCFKECWEESRQGLVTFDDIEHRYMAQFLSVAYSLSSPIPNEPKKSAPGPDLPNGVSLRDLIEVHKLCDRFICPKMTSYVNAHISTVIAGGHRGLMIFKDNIPYQKQLIQSFSDAYEALDLDIPAQNEIGDALAHHFCEGISYTLFQDAFEDFKDKPNFLWRVSQEFANKLEYLQTTKKFRRKELAAPEFAQP